MKTEAELKKGLWLVSQKIDFENIEAIKNTTIDYVLKEIGSCSECIHWEMYLISSADSGLCRLTRSDKKSNGYCDDFESKGDK